jgi:hypothetical protein
MALDRWASRFTVAERLLSEMDLNDYLYDCHNAFEERNYYFWIRTVIDALDLIGPQTDGHLENMKLMLLNYARSTDASPEAVERIPHEIRRLRGTSFWRDTSPIGLKYRCLQSLAHSREKNLEDPYFWWGYALNSAFDFISLAGVKDQTLDAFVRENASKYDADL